MPLLFFMIRGICPLCHYAVHYNFVPVRLFADFYLYFFLLLKKHIYLYFGSDIMCSKILKDRSSCMWGKYFYLLISCYTLELYQIWFWTLYIYSIGDILMIFKNSTKTGSLKFNKKYVVFQFVSRVFEWKKCISYLKNRL